MSKFFAGFQNFDIIEVTKIKEIKYYERNHSSQLTAHSSQLTAHADYVIGRVFCQALKQAFSHFCEKAFYVEFSELSLERNGELQYA
ncbi:MULTISPECIES: hypothetical protein [Streptococcus]|uniref:Uncharacterized protein n=2 Tax=Streptococcus TaxID=1301 RepID=A0A3R9J953_STROR|nr:MULTISPECIES: hypothetical protein [Streptococcus]MBN6011475.1 hypothetical protein [Streptococcus oralis subsp. oralis]MDY4364470.1 hypothetical protein [Streptococcus sp. 21WXBC0044M1]RSI72344.1 hypothetical protein D8860_00830 [Streptococcus oralis]